MQDEEKKGLVNYIPFKIFQAHVFIILFSLRVSSNNFRFRDTCAKARFLSLTLILFQISRKGEEQVKY